MALGRYLKAAFLQHWNLLVFSAGVVFSVLTGRADIFLPLVIAGEVGYLGLLGTHPKFQRAIDAQEAKARREQATSRSEEVLRRIRNSLPAESLARYERLRARCLELRGIGSDLHASDPALMGSGLDDMQVAGLDRLLWIYLRLLYTEWSLDRFFVKTSEVAIREDIQRLEAQLAEIGKGEKSLARDRARSAVEDNLRTSRDRLENYEKAHENRELMRLEIDRLENKIRTVSELAVNRREADFISGQVDAVASSMMDAERTMNELRFATGLTSAEEAVPELMNGLPPETVVEAEGPEEPPPPRRRRFGI